ncbi:MAG: hypothetical protein LBB98_01005 [Treponema sp.]|nr:hypothetical protein [Treponema sp.]
MNDDETCVPSNGAKKGTVRNMPAKIATMMAAGEYGVMADVFSKRNTGNNTAMPREFFLIYPPPYISK